MKIVIPDGSGHLGRILAAFFSRQGHEVVVLQRGTTRGPWRSVVWDGRNQGPWCAEIDGADVVINLAGRSVDCRYGARNRRLIHDSRIQSTSAIGQAIADAARPPGVWLQMSTATIYAHTFEKANDELNGIIGGAEDKTPDTWRFSIEVAKSWEAEAERWQREGTRQVGLRTTMVMSATKGGALERFIGLARCFLGGRIAGGKQYISWIHEQDFVQAVVWLIHHEEMTGAVNLAAPNPITNENFAAVLRESLGVRFGLATPRWLLEIGAFFLRTESELILKSRKVVPGRLSESGFQFKYPHWQLAATDLVNRAS